MPDYDDTNRGALFRNNKKEKPTHSDYNGSINVGGVDYYLNAWMKTSKAGAKYMSLSVKAKDSAPHEPSTPLGNFDKDLPF